MIEHNFKVLGFFLEDVDSPDVSPTGRLVHIEIEVPPTGCPNLPPGKDRYRRVWQNVYIGNAAELSREEVRQTAINLLQWMAERIDAGAPVYPPNVCDICARYIPAHLTECIRPDVER